MTVYIIETNTNNTFKVRACDKREAFRTLKTMTGIPMSAMRSSAQCGSICKAYND